MSEIANSLWMAFNLAPVIIFGIWCIGTPLLFIIDSMLGLGLQLLLICWFE